MKYSNAGSWKKIFKSRNRKIEKNSLKYDQLIFFLSLSVSLILCLPLSLPFVCVNIYTHINILMYFQLFLHISTRNYTVFTKYFIWVCNHFIKYSTVNIFQYTNEHIYLKYTKLPHKLLAFIPSTFVVYYDFLLYRVYCTNSWYTLWLRALAFGWPLFSVLPSLFPFLKDQFKEIWCMIQL